MVNVKSYISSGFFSTFLTIFLPFVMIISLVFLVRIATFTSKIGISFGEMLQLYIYSIPEIFFYTIPLSFVAAISNLLLRLSQENELIALYALGMNAKQILRTLLRLALLFTLLLGTISLLAMPLSQQFYRAFEQEKKSDAQINIVAGELGQKFGSYTIYVKEKKEDTFYDIVIYNQLKKENEQFFSAQKGKLKHYNGLLSLELYNGYGYTYFEDRLRQTEYKRLQVFDTTQKRGFHFKPIEAYWNDILENPKLMREMLFLLFIALIPLLSIYMIASFAMINPRYQKSRSFMIIFLTTLLLYFLATLLQKWGTPLLFITIVSAMLLLGQWLFQKRVSRYF